MEVKCNITQKLRKGRGTDTPVHHPEKPAGSTHSSTRGLRLPEQLERQPEFHSSDKTRHDSPVPTLQGPCSRSPNPRGSLRFLPPLESPRTCCLTNKQNLAKCLLLIFFLFSSIVFLVSYNFLNLVVVFGFFSLI